MSESLFESIAVFANPDGRNSHSKNFIKLLAKSSAAEFTVLSLAEKLPDYTSFPDPNRKARLEDLISAAATSAIKELEECAEECKATCTESKLIEGRFPTALIEWVDSSSATLLVKESLPCDGDYGNASKGDIKLTRKCSTPVLLAHAPVTEGDPVLVGIAPEFGDESADRFCISLLENAASFAKLFGGSLFVVNAWDLWGESLIRSRVPAEEIEEAKKEYKQQAESAVERVVSKAELGGVSLERMIGKGDPSKVLSGAINMVKPGLVVLGSTAKEGIAGALLGNTAEMIAREKKSSVLIIR